MKIIRSQARREDPSEEAFDAAVATIKAWPLALESHPRMQNDPSDTHLYRAVGELVAHAVENGASLDTFTDLLRQDLAHVEGPDQPSSGS